MKRFITLIMAALMSLSAFSLVGCGGGNKNSGIDDSKSQLNVGIFNAGLGTAWLEESIKDFEKLYANKSFEDGKVGVQVIMDAKKDEFKASSLLATMKYNDNAMYFLDQSDYAGFRSAGLLADITDTINEKIYDENGDLAAFTDKEAVQSIMDTMNEDWVGFHAVNENGAEKYYAIPYRVGVSGIIYDADLFDLEKLYFFANDTIGANQEDIDNGLAGVGPDGVAGTSDDGMPKTWSQFVTLLNEMTNNHSVTPFTWSGNTDYQRWYAYESIWANYEGLTNFKKNYTLEGCVNDAQVDQLAAQLGRRAGIKAFKDITSNANYFSAMAKSQSYLEAQFEYVDSINTNKRIAFFIQCRKTSREPSDNVVLRRRITNTLE